MGETYLIELANHIGDMQINTRCQIEAESRQKVKYWLHRHFKQFGHKPGWATNKHTFDVGGRVVELEWIEHISDPTEATVLREHLAQFPKQE